MADEAREERRRERGRYRDKGLLGIKEVVDACWVSCPALSSGHSDFPSIRGCEGSGHVCLSCVLTVDWLVFWPLMIGSGVNS